jgi:hypothetical protein
MDKEKRRIFGTAMQRTLLIEVQDCINRDSPVLTARADLEQLTVVLESNEAQARRFTLKLERD